MITPVAFLIVILFTAAALWIQETITNSESRASGGVTRFHPKE